MFLGRLAYLDGKPEGDKSMPGKRWPSGGVHSRGCRICLASSGADACLPEQTVSCGFMAPVPGVGRVRASLLRPAWVLVLLHLAGQYRDVHVLAEMIMRCEGCTDLRGEGRSLIWRGH